MDWISKFKLALAADGVNALRPLNELVIADPTTPVFSPFAEIAGRDNLGREIETGLPTARWTWDWLPQTDIDVLQGYEKQYVYVTTVTERGVTREFKTYYAYMQRLRLGDIGTSVAFDGPNDGLRQRRSVEVEFTAMELQG